MVAPAFLRVNDYGATLQPPRLGALSYRNAELRRPVLHNESGMKLFKRTLWSGAAIVVLWLAVCAVAGVRSADWVLHPDRRALTPADEAEATAMADSDHAALLEAAITASDGAVLRAWYIRPVPGNGDAVILLHGQADNRAGMLGPAALLLRHGYAVLMPDARAQGMSGGDLATYGIKEADDIRRWFDWLAQTQAPRCIDGLGDSMGAAQILQSLNTERGFCAVVAESPFASFREASYDRIGEWLGARSRIGPRIGPLIGRTVLRPVVDFGFVYVRLRYAVNLAQDDPAQAVAESHVPVFLIDGLLDNNLPPRNSEKILAASRSRNNNVALWEPPDAGHTGALGAEPAEYERRVIGWLEAHEAAGSR